MEWETEGPERGRLRVWEVLFQEDGTTLVDTVVERTCAFRVEATWYVAVSALPTLPARLGIYLT
jgi:hypothetical protein